MISVISS